MYWITEAYSNQGPILIGAALMAVNSMCPGVNLTECTDFLFHQNLIVELQ